MASVLSRANHPKKNKIVLKRAQVYPVKGMTPYCSRIESRKFPFDSCPEIWTWYIFSLYQPVSAAATLSLDSSTQMGRVIWKKSCNSKYRLNPYEIFMQMVVFALKGKNWSHESIYLFYVARSVQNCFKRYAMTTHVFFDHLREVELTQFAIIHTESQVLTAWKLWSLALRNPGCLPRLHWEPWRVWAGQEARKNLKDQERSTNLSPSGSIIYWSSPPKWSCNATIQI